MERKVAQEIKNVDQLIRQCLNQSLGEELKGIDITHSQGMMIDYIHKQSQKGEVLQKDIEKEFCIRPSTATVLLQALEKKEMIYRQEVSNDKRSKAIYLTDKGEKLKQKVDEIFREFHTWLIEDITEEEREQLLHIMDKLKKRLQEGEKQDGERTSKTNTAI